MIKDFFFFLEKGGYHFNLMTKMINDRDQYPIESSRRVKVENSHLKILVCYLFKCRNMKDDIENAY